MPGRLSRMDVQAAFEDLKNRTLSGMGTEFARLIYLASTRDYNTGRYYHDGLAFQFSEETAGKALAEAHTEVFLDLALGSLESLVDQLQLYLRSVGAEPGEIVRVWEKLQPYRVAIPMDSDALTAALFSANVKLALTVVESRQKGQPPDPQSA
jgi:hypothetical protein